MPEPVEHQILGWIKTIVGDSTAIRLAQPVDLAANAGVNVYLLSFAHAPTRHLGPHRPQLQYDARYLISATSNNISAAHMLLNRLIFAGMAHETYQIDLDVPLNVWGMFGVAPRPALILSTLIREQRPEPQTPVVRHPPVIAGSPIGTLVGQVLTPDDIPLAGIGVEHLSLQRTTRTDHNGYFTFTGISTEQTPHRLRLKGKGKIYDVRIHSADMPTSIYWDVLNS